MIKIQNQPKRWGSALLLCFSLIALGQRHTVAQQPVPPVPPLGASNNGVLIDQMGIPIYGVANIKPTTWLGLNILHANFAIMPQSGQKPVLGNVAIVPTAEAGTFLFISDVGVNGVFRSRSGGVVWEDSGGRKGKYIPL